MSRDSPWDLYAKGLMPLGYGYPLWGPEPDPSFGEVNIGDVGYIRDGHFCFLFNAMRSADHPVNQLRGVPSGFEVFRPRHSMVIDRPDEITQSQLHSKSLQSVSISAGASAGDIGAAASAGLQYRCSEEFGALLMLKQSANKTYLECRMHIQQYVRAHISKWCSFANDEFGIGLEEQDLIFVSGHTKTSVWGAAAFQHSSASAELRIGGGCFVPSVSGEFNVSMSRCSDASVFSRCGPRDLVSTWNDDTPMRIPKYQQCIFVNYYKMKSRRWPLRPAVIQAAAGPHELPDDGDDDDSASTDSWGAIVYADDEYEGLHETFDPVDSLLDYILKNSDAEMACASDDDLIGICKDGVFPDNIEAALQTLAPRIVVDASGLGQISMHEEEAGPCAPPPSRTQVPQPSTREAREDEEHVLLDTFEVRAPTSNATGEARRGFSRPHKPKRSPDENPVISEGALPIPNSSSARAIPFGTMLPWSNIHGHDPPAMTEHCGMHRTCRHISIPCSNHLDLASVDAPLLYLPQLFERAPMSSKHVDVDIQQQSRDWLADPWAIRTAPIIQDSERICISRTQCDVNEVPNYTYMTPYVPPSADPIVTPLAISTLGQPATFLPHDQCSFQTGQHSFVTTSTDFTLSATPVGFEHTAPSTYFNTSHLDVSDVIHTRMHRRPDQTIYPIMQDPYPRHNSLSQSALVGAKGTDSAFKLLREVTYGECKGRIQEGRIREGRIRESDLPRAFPAKQQRAEDVRIGMDACQHRRRGFPNPQKRFNEMSDIVTSASRSTTLNSRVDSTKSDKEPPIPVLVGRKSLSRSSSGPSNFRCSLQGPPVMISSDPRFQALTNGYNFAEIYSLSIPSNAIQSHRVWECNAVQMVSKTQADHRDKHAGRANTASKASGLKEYEVAPTLETVIALLSRKKSDFRAEFSPGRNHIVGMKLGVSYMLHAFVLKPDYCDSAAGVWSLTTLLDISFHHDSSVDPTLGACSSLSSRDTIIGGREEISYAALGGFTWAYSNPAAYEHSLLHGVQNKHGTDVDDECDLLSSMDHRPPTEGSARQEDTTADTTSESPASEAFTCEFRRMVLPAGFLRGATPHWTSEGTAVHPPNTTTKARSRPLVAHKGSFDQSDQSEADHATHPPSVEKAVFFPDSHAYPVYYTITHSMVDQQALSSLTVETESARGSQTAKLLLPF